MFSLLCFYIAGGLQTFASGVDAAVMLAAAFFLMMGNVPIGEVIWG